MSFKNFSRGITGRRCMNYVTHSIKEIALRKSSGSWDVTDTFSDEIG